MPGVDQLILSPIIGCHAVAMCRPVVLNHQALVRIVEVRPGDEDSMLVAKRDLRARPRQPREDKQEAQPVSIAVRTSSKQPRPLTVLKGPDYGDPSRNFRHS